MTGDPDPGRGLRLRQAHRLGHGVRVQVAARPRTPLRGQLPGQLAAHARPAAGHHRELPRERIHSHDAYLRYKSRTPVRSPTWGAPPTPGLDQAGAEGQPGEVGAAAAAGLVPD